MGARSSASGRDAWPEPRGRLLVVDDDPDARDILAEFFKAYGYGVDVAYDGAQALDILRRSPRFDVILLDLLMPRMTGPELLRAIRDESPTLARTPVVVISAVPNNFLAMRVPTFVKPAPLMQVLLKVEELIARS